MEKWSHPVYKPGDKTAIVTKEERFDTVAVGGIKKSNTTYVLQHFIYI